VEVVTAKPAEALIEVADRVDASFIVVGSYGESPLRSALLGSTPHKLLHLTTRPVLVVPQAD
jgi:nucleotide-binding universal stress UspA family protein